MTLHDTLTDDDLTAYVDDLRSRLDRIPIALPDVDALLAETGGSLPARRPRRRAAIVLAVAAVTALVAGIIVTRTRDHQTAITTVGDRREQSDDPLDGITLLGPPEVSGGNVTASTGADPEIKDPDAYQGNVDNYLGGAVGGPARLVSLMSAPPSAPSPPFGAVGAGVVDLTSWFKNGLEYVYPNTLVATPAEVAGAKTALLVDANTRMNDVDHHQLMIVAQTPKLNVVVATAGYDLEELAKLAATLEIDGDRARLTTLPEGVTSIGSSNRSHRMSAAYTVASAGTTVMANPLDDAAFAITQVHFLANGSDRADDLTVVRGAPNWVLSVDDGMHSIVGVRDGLWVRLMRTGLPDGMAQPPADAIDSLQPMSRSRFDDLVKWTTAQEANRNNILPEQRDMITDHGRWLPMSVPKNARLQRVFLAGIGAATPTAGLPALWNPVNGSFVRFGPLRPLLSGVVTRARAPLGDHLVELTGVMDGLVSAQVWATVDPASPAVEAHARNVPADQLDTILAAITWSPARGGTWSIVPPAGWEAIAGSDQDPTATEDFAGYSLDFGEESIDIFTDVSQQRDNVLSFLESGTALRSTTPDGRTMYSSTFGKRHSVLVLGAAGEPDVTVGDSKLPVDQLVAFARSVRPMSVEEADAFLQPVTGG